MPKKPFYITTPIYYPSAQPHMGHAYSSIVADVFARFKRIDNFDVFFLTGTDEHGLKIQKAAKSKNQSPLDFCNSISKTFKDLSITLNLSNDDFIRTTEERHKKSVQHLWNKLIESDDIYLSKYKGWYSISDEAYYNEDEVTIKENKHYSNISGSLVEWVEEDSYFFKLSKWQDKLLKFYKSNNNFILPKSRMNEVVSFVERGLKDLSVSRTSFTWGIQVPNDDKHVIYVWLDALTNYISALNFPDTGKTESPYKKFWPADIHIIGKDILRFHAVYWPAFLMAANVPVPKRIFGHGWILSNEEKMSKSKGNILNPLEIVKEYGLDQVRYYLMKEVSLGHDGSISPQSLINCINNDLANNFGNLCQRVFTFVKKNCDNQIPQFAEFKEEDNLLLNALSNQLNDIRKMIDSQEINNYINTIVKHSFNSNKYFNDMKPWSIKDDPKRLNNIIYVMLEMIRKLSILLFPIMPTTSKKVFKILNLKINQDNLLNFDDNKCLKPGTSLNEFNVLFEKVS